MEPGPGLAGQVPSRLLNRLGREEVGGGDQADVHAEEGPGDQKGVGRVVAGIPDVAEGDLLERLARVVPHGFDISQHLRGVPLVGQTVPDRHPGERGQQLDGLLGEAAVLDSVEHPTEYPGRVLDRLGTPDMGSLGTEVGHLRALVVRPDLEGAPRAGRCLLEDQGDIASDHTLTLIACTLLLAQLVGQIDQEEELLLREVHLLEQAPPVQVHVARPHAASRTMGHVMQRGPPRPRPSSLPSMEITSMPCLRSMVLVATLRS